MEITIVAVLGLVTVCITYVFGLIAKRLPWFDDDYIPLQNFTIGIASGFICFKLGIDGMSLATALITCLLSSMGAGGLYDLVKTK